MRARIFAVLILIIFLGVPLSLYWYFYEKKVSSMIFLSDKNIPYTITLDGKLEYKYFPLLDKAFHYRSTCRGSCIFSPIPPLRYALSIDIEGRESLHDTIVLTSGSEVRYDVKIGELLTLEKYGTFPPSEDASLVEGYNLAGISRGGKSIVWRAGNPGEVAVINKGKIVPIISLQGSAQNITLDATRQYVLVRASDATTRIYPLDGSEGVAFPYDITVRSVSSLKPNIVRTESGLYEKSGVNWTENPRFTDYIDLSPRYRVGYIDETDKSKLILANLPVENSLLILLDRTTGESNIIKKGIAVKALFYDAGEPTLLDNDGTLWKITLSL